MTSEPIPSSPSGVMNAHNVLLIVDAESLLSRYPNPSQDAQVPTPISDGFIFFAVGDHSKEIVINDSKVILPVDIGRHIHFRGRTVSLIAEYSVVFYSMTVDSDSVLSAPALEVHENLSVPAPNPENPSEPGGHQAHDHFWTCDSKTPGVAQCEVSFMLVNQRCEAVGYFVWAVEMQVTG